MTDDTMGRTAVISPDGRYRYSLTRTWYAPGWRRALFIMLNPSTRRVRLADRRRVGWRSSRPTPRRAGDADPRDAVRAGPTAHQGRRTRAPAVRARRRTAAAAQGHVMALCTACLAGRHPHDRYTRSGADAGCPYMAGPYECDCPVVLPTTVERGCCPTCGQSWPARQAAP